MDDHDNNKMELVARGAWLELRLSYAQLYVRRHVPCGTSLTEALRGVLANDPRPRYQDDPARVYAMDFAGMNIKFTVCGDTLMVTEIEKSELN